MSLVRIKAYNLARNHYSLYWFRVEEGILNSVEFKISFWGDLGMAWNQLEIDQPQVVTNKYSEPQAVESDVMGKESGVAILLSIQKETWWD